MSGWPVAGSGLRAHVNAKKSSGVRAKKTGRESATMSTRRPSSRYSFTAMPRPSVA